MPRPQTVARWFGANVRKHRLAQGLTQGELAEAVGLEPLMIRLLETARRRPSFETIVKLATALEVDVSELFIAARLIRNPVGRPRKRR